MKNSKRGSSSVFLVIILAAMTGTAGLFIYAAKQSAYTGMGEGALHSGMRSVLSEFDLELKERYDLMAFEKSGMEASLEISDYTDFAFNSDNPVKNIEAGFDGYVLSDVNVLKEQILDYMALAAAEDMFNDVDKDSERTDYTDRTLRNKAVLNNLPSIPFDGSDPGFLAKLENWKENADSIKEIFNNNTQAYLIDQYIIEHFKHAAGGPVEDESFFEHEVEYIIAGNYSNKNNRETVETGLKVLRTALNAAYIYADEKKSSETLAAAELLTPGAAPATQAVLVTTWAAAEADNDVKLLLKGKPVPVMKTADSWATDLDGILENITDDCIDTGNKEGLLYSDYMKIFLHFTDENLKLARVADLIQINMKGTYGEDFLMRTTKTGMSLKAEIYGKEVSYETCY